MGAEKVVDFSERARRVLADDRKPSEPKETAVEAALAVLNPRIHEKWHTSDREPMITLRNTETGVDSHHSLNSSETAEFLNYQHYLAVGKAPSEGTLKGVIGLLSAQAKYEGEKHEVFSRIGHWKDEIYVDLGNEKHEVVRISPALLPVGFAVLPSTDSPVRFRANPSAQAQPAPLPGGSLDSLWVLFPNVSPEDQILVTGHLIGCFQQHGGRAFLEILGGQGSGKSTLGRCLIALIDANLAPLRAMPRNEQDLLISVMHRIVAGMDNLSTILPEMADAFCRISTGAALSGRKLFTDSAEALFIAQLILIWTAIEPQAVRKPDLQDRTITIRLDQLATNGVASEREVIEVFEEIRPLLTGAIYTAVAVGLSRIDQVQIEKLPRLADFAIWVEACAPAFGWEEGKFLETFESSRAIASAMAVDASPVGILIVKMMESREHWEGKASELLTVLKELADDDQRRSRSFPKDAIRLSGQLRRMVQPLASVGVWVGFDRSGASRGIILDRKPTPTIPPIPTSPIEGDEQQTERNTYCAWCNEPLPADRIRLCAKCTGDDL